MALVWFFIQSIPLYRSSFIYDIRHTFFGQPLYELQIGHIYRDILTPYGAIPRPYIFIYNLALVDSAPAAIFQMFIW